jgi:hypothetical protein
MSSPTINIGSGGNGGSYPSLEEIANYVRALINDSQAGATGTPGEGQIFTDNPAISPFVQPMINASIREVYRELRNIGAPTLIRDNVIVSGLTPINGPNGLGQADPAVQVFLSYGGYFDGQTINSALLLPGDMLFPVRVWERQTDSNNTFTPMHQPQFGLPSRPQASAFGEWEWREDKVWMIGSTQIRDLRFRYYCSLPQFFSATLDFASTFVPVLDSGDAIALKTATKYARMLGSPGLPDLIGEAKEQMFQLKNQYTRRAQSVDYHRVPFGSYGSTDTNNQFFLSW